MQRQSLISTQSRNILNQDQTLHLPSLQDKIRPQEIVKPIRQPRHRHQGTLDSLDQFLYEDIPIAYPTQEKQVIYIFRHTSTKFQTESNIQPMKTISRRGSQLFEFKGENRSTLDSIEPVLISPPKPIKKMGRRNASLMMLPDYDMNKFFTLDPQEIQPQQKNIQFEANSPPKEIISRKYHHKHHKSQPECSKQYKLVGFTDYVEALYGPDWFQQSQLDDFFNN